MNIFPQHDWRLIGFRGLIAAIFGIVIIAVPGISLKALIAIFGIYIFLDSVFSMLTAIRARKKLESWHLTLIKGIVGVILAVLVITLPGISAVALAYFLGAWFCLLGIIEIASAFRLRKEVEGGGWLIGAGVLSLGVGVFLFAWPTASMIAITLVVGVFTLVLGLILLLHAWRIRRFQVDA